MRTKENRLLMQSKFYNNDDSSTVMYTTMGVLYKQGTHNVNSGIDFPHKSHYSQSILCTLYLNVVVKCDFNLINFWKILHLNFNIVFALKQGKKLKS